MTTMTGYDPVRYKISSIHNWNAVAQGYHSEWASKNRGPFKSTAELVKAADIKPSHHVLDLACGTGAVSMQAARMLGPAGMLVGIDFSRVALEIARASVPDGHFFEMDAENVGIQLKFDRILCQYAMMFFPDPDKVLRILLGLLKAGGILTVAVHGTPAGVPYFSTVMEPVLRHIPDVSPERTPTVTRFGDPVDLKFLMAGAGLSNISIKEFTFDYQAGTFEEYWSDYMSTTANSIRSAIESKGSNVLSAIKDEAERKAKQFTNGGKICFPWQVFIATATPAQD